MKRRILRVLLLASAAAWGVSVVGVFLPWDVAVTALQGLGARAIPTDPMLDYWMRMASGAFFGVGVFFLMLAWRPDAFANVIPLAGGLMLLEGITLAVHGLRLHLRPFPFWADTAFCLFVGAGIVALSMRTSESAGGKG